MPTEGSTRGNCDGIAEENFIFEWQLIFFLRFELKMKTLFEFYSNKESK